MALVSRISALRRLAVVIQPQPQQNETLISRISCIRLEMSELRRLAAIHDRLQQDKVYQEAMVASPVSYGKLILDKDDDRSIRHFGIGALGLPSSMVAFILAEQAASGTLLAASGTMALVSGYLIVTNLVNIPYHRKKFILSQILAFKSLTAEEKKIADKHVKLQSNTVYSEMFKESPATYEAVLRRMC